MAPSRGGPVDPGALVGSRRESRETALGLLYQADIRSLDPIDVLEQQAFDPEPYVVTLVHNCATHRDRIDELISRFAKGWRLERMPAIDRALLRMATAELLDEAEIPRGVVLNEAVELAGMYSTEKSSGFVNGVLSSIADDLRR